MKTWRGLAIDDYLVGQFDDGTTFSLKRGKDYCLGGVDGDHDGKVFLMSRSWTWVPREWFAGIKPEYGHSAESKP